MTGILSSFRSERIVAPREVTQDCDLAFDLKISFGCLTLRCISRRTIIVEAPFNRCPNDLLYFTGSVKKPRAGVKTLQTNKLFIPICYIKKLYVLHTCTISDHDFTRAGLQNGN